MALLWEPLKKKKKITHEVYSTSQEPQRKQIMTLQHMHYLFISLRCRQLRKHNKIRPRSQYCVLFNRSITISAWQHLVQDNTCQEPLLKQDKPNYDISATCNLSFFLKMGSHVKGGQVFYWWNHHGILLLFLFHQNATDQCLLQRWRHIHHTIGQSIMQPKCSLSPYFLHAYVRWTVWTGLYYTFKHKIRTCPSPVIPSGIKWH